MAESGVHQASSTTTELAVPASLRQLAIQIKEADEFGVASDLVRDANELVEAAWDGTLCERIVGRRIRLSDAIQRSTSVLDAASAAYIHSNTAEMRAMAGNFASFDGARFKRDVLKSFKSLKELNFTGLGTLHYNHIQSALTKHEEFWSDGPLNDEIVAIQQFCMHIEAVTESLGDRTARRISNDMVALREKPNKALSYNSAAARIYGTDKYPACVKGPFDWARLFGANPDDDDEDGPWLTPRMAARIHRTALFLATLMLDYDDDNGILDNAPRLPRIARPFFKNSNEWRLSFRDCYVRIAMRLQKGLPPEPNCTGEELAFHNIMDEAPYNSDEMDDDDDELPTFPNDDEYDTVRECAVQDDDVLDLYEKGDNGCYSDTDSDEDETRVDNPVHGKKVSFMLGAMGAVYLHPGEWFIAFKDKHFTNHLG